MPCEPECLFIVANYWHNVKLFMATLPTVAVSECPGPVLCPHRPPCPLCAGVARVEARAVSRDILTSESNVGAAGVFAVETRASPLPPTCPLELETKVHPKIRNHGEGPY